MLAADSGAPRAATSTTASRTLESLCLISSRSFRGDDEVRTAVFGPRRFVMARIERELLAVADGAQPVGPECPAKRDTRRAVTARRSPNARLYSAVPRSSQCPSIVTVQVGVAFQQRRVLFECLLVRGAELAAVQLVVDRLQWRIPVEVVERGPRRWRRRVPARPVRRSARRPAGVGPADGTAPTPSGGRRRRRGQRPGDRRLVLVTGDRRREREHREDHSNRSNGHRRFSSHFDQSGS